MKPILFVLRRPTTAYGPAAYYPPGAAVHAKWLSATAAETFRDTLVDSPAWTVMPEKEARAQDKRDAKAIRDAEIRRVLREAYDAHGKRAFTETPGDLMAFPQLRNGDIVQVPVVVVRAIGTGPARGYVAKFSDNALHHLPLDWPLQTPTVEHWHAHLAKWNALNIKAES